jgi:hypothetical protein
MAWFLSVVIDIINVRRAIIKTENHPPVGPDGRSPKTFHLAFERMQLKPRQIHVGNGWGGMKGRWNIPQFLGMFGFTPLGSSCSNRRFTPLWRIVFIISNRNPPRVACQD